MTLDVLISTLGYDGIKRVVDMNLPHVDGVNYIVSWQLPDEKKIPGIVPNELLRSDVKVYQLNSRGISINRNNAINHSSADICLTADDDLVYTPRQLQDVIKTFEENDDCDVATFMYSSDCEKSYPSQSFDLREMPKGYYISEIEIAFRRDVGHGKLLFNEYFGPGAHLLQAGEGAIFIHYALSMGLNCRFFPIKITHHAGLSTGNRRLSAGVVMAQGAYFAIVYPGSALLRIPLFAWRSWRAGRVKLFPAMSQLVKGYIYGKRYFNIDGSLKSRPPR